MKTSLVKLCFAFFLLAAGPAFAGNTTRLDVTVRTDPGGAVAYQGKADVRGNFNAPNLKPGNYIIEFHADNAAAIKSQKFSIAVAGKQRVTANGVAGDKFGGGGVAMKVQVGKAGKLTGQVASAQTAGMETVRANVKVMHGKRYVWVPGQIGSQIGGKWVEEGSEEAALSNSNNRGNDNEVLRKIQDMGGLSAAKESHDPKGGLNLGGGRP